jgi:hypothetical protein
MPRFPKRVYTEDEVEQARKLVEAGYKHRIRTKGSPTFRKRVRDALQHVKEAGFYDFLRTYIGQIVEIDGFSQLRESEAAIWANDQLLNAPVEAAGFFVQKAYQMKEFLEGQLYYGGAAEARSVEKRIAFLESLELRSHDMRVKKECANRLKQWAESTFI